MPSVQIDDKDLPVLSEESLIALSKYGTQDSQDNTRKTPTLEEIYDALRKTYSHEQLYQLDAEFVLQAMQQHWSLPADRIDPDFAEKIYGTLAILLNPLEITQDLSAFINTTLLANDQPTVTGDGELVPSRYIPRMIDAVNHILPDDQDFHEVFWQDNITKYIIECYRSEDNRILDDALAYMDNSYFESQATVSQEGALRELVHTLRNLGRELWDGLPESIKGSEKTIEERVEGIKKEIDDKVPQDLRDNEFLMTMLGKYIINKMYVKYYNDLR